MAQDLTNKRRTAAVKAIAAATQIVDGINTLVQLQAERKQWAEDFQDADFAQPELVHLTPYLAGVLLDTVTPTLCAAYADAPNKALATQILLQLRG